MEYALQLTKVSKTYPRGVEALKGISLEVAKGEVFGLLGPNGAGKSTLVKILTALIRPSVCEGTLLGMNVGDRRGLRDVGFLPEHVRFPDYLTGRQVVEFSAGLQEVPVNETQKRTDQLLELVSMTQFQKRKISTYSKGMKQRVGLAQALVNDPKLIFLDEPTDGVDPAGRHQFREIMLGLKAEGKTVFINSHLLPEVESVADRVAILAAGIVLKTGAVEELAANKAEFRMEYEGVCPEAVLRKFGCQQPREGLLVVGTQNVKEVQPVIDALRQEGISISSLTRTGQSLEELYLEVVGQTGGVQ